MLAALDWTLNNPKIQRANLVLMSVDVYQVHSCVVEIHRRVNADSWLVSDWTEAVDCPKILRHLDGFAVGLATW